MKESVIFPQILEELKKILKKKKIRYQQLAEKLEMSESSIKRLMVAKDLPLSRLEQLCEIAGISLFDLMDLSKDAEIGPLILTEEQEKFFRKNTAFFYFFCLIYEREHSLSQVKKEQGLDEYSLNHYLNQLEKLGLLERHPNDVIKFLKKGQISLTGVENNSLGRHIMNVSIKNFSHLMNERLGDLSQKTTHRGGLKIGDRLITEESAQKFQKKYEQLEEELNRTEERENRVHKPNELVNYSSIFALLPMRLYFEEIPRIKPKKLV